MQKLPNNAKAILGAVTLALFSFAGVKAGAFGLQQQRLDGASLRSPELRVHTALSRVLVTAIKVGLIENRRPVNILAAHNGTASFSHRLCFAGVASTTAPAVSSQSQRCTASPRAPPSS